MAEVAARWRHLHIHIRIFLWLGPREREGVSDSMIMYAYVPWSSFVPCCLPPASPFRMGPPRSVRSLASFLSPDRTAGRVVYLCHSSTQIRLSYLFSPVAFLAMPFQGCNATAAPLGSQGRALLAWIGKIPPRTSKSKQRKMRD